MKVAPRICLPLAFLFLLNGSLLTAEANAQTAQQPDAPPADSAKTMPPMEMPPGTPPANKAIPPGMPGKAVPTLPNLSLRKGWPSPVSDAETYGYLLFDLLEHRWNNNGANTVRWDVVGWRGGDYNRFWFKSEGRAALACRRNTSVVLSARL